MPKKLLPVFFVLCGILAGVSAAGCSGKGGSTMTFVSPSGKKITLNAKTDAQLSMMRAVRITDETIWKYVNYDNWINYGTVDPVARYNPSTHTKSGGSYNAFEYTQIIEMLIAGMKALDAARDLPGASPLWQEMFDYYEGILWGAFDNLEFYMGFTRVASSTRVNRRWDQVIGVPRRGSRNYMENDVGGTLTVYDDQMWLIRALLESYFLLDKESGRAGGNERLDELKQRKTRYLEYATYLAIFTLDGYDQSFRDDNNPSLGRWGGVPWGPWYGTKHACSNGPFISPLVWLHEIYSKEGFEATFTSPFLIKILFDDRPPAGGYPASLTVSSSSEIAWRERLPGTGSADSLVRSRSVPLKDFFLEYALGVYNFTVEAFMRGDGVFGDMRGGTASSDGPPRSRLHGNLVTYTGLGDLVGSVYTYNTGSPLSGIIDLYRVMSEKTGSENEALALKLREQAVKIADASFAYFADPNVKEGFYRFPQGVTGKADFDSILLRAWTALVVYDIYPEAIRFINEFARTLNYGYDNFLVDGFLPVDHLSGWNPELVDTNSHGARDDVDVPNLRTFNYAAQFSWIALAKFSTETAAEVLPESTTLPP